MNEKSTCLVGNFCNEFWSIFGDHGLEITFRPYNNESIGFLVTLILKQEIWSFFEMQIFPLQSEKWPHRTISSSTKF